MEKLWRLDTLENYRLGKTKDALQWSNTRNQTEGLKMLRKIMNWATSESGKEVLTGVFWGAVGIIAVRLFCFLVCLATGYPADIWHIFGQEKLSGLNIRSFFFGKNVTGIKPYRGKATEKCYGKDSNTPRKNVTNTNSL